ncbi:hypothetical protein [Bacillus mobilis]
MWTINYSKPYIDKKGRYFNWSDDLKDKLLLSVTACKLGGVPVEEKEEPLAYIYSDNSRTFFPVFDRTDKIRIIEFEEMGGYYFIGETARRLLNIKRMPRNVPKIGLFNCRSSWEIVYDLQNHIEREYDFVKEKPNLKETGLISTDDLYKIDFEYEEFMEKPREIQYFYYDYGRFHALYDVKEERKYKAWKMKKLFEEE